MRSILLDRPARSAARVAAALLVTASLAAVACPAMASERPLVILTDGQDTTALEAAHNIASVIAEGATPGAVVIAGTTGGEARDATIAAGGVDAVITQATALTGADTGSTLAVVSKLYDEEIHVVAAPGVGAIEDLAGKPVNLGPAGSAGALSARLVFDRLGVAVIPLHMPHAIALTRLQRSEIAASVVVTGKPSRLLSVLPRSAGLRLLAVPYPDTLDTGFLPAKLSATDYPELVAAQAPVATVAVAAVLAAPVTDGDKGGRLARLTQALTNEVDRLRAPHHHPKWRDMHALAGLEGFARHPAAAKLATAGNTNRTASVPWAAPPPPASPFIASETPPAMSAPAPAPVAAALSARASQLPAAPRDSDPFAAFAEAARAAQGNPAEQERLFQQLISKTASRATAAATP